MPVYYGPLPPNPADFDAWADTSTVPFGIFTWDSDNNKWCFVGFVETHVYLADEVPADPPIGCVRLSSSGLERYNGTDWVASGVCSGSGGGDIT